MEKKKVKKYTCEVSDFEHCGDLENEVAHIKSICPDASNFRTWEEEDYEAEADYKEDYGELDENIYRGFVEFTAPISCEELLREHNIY